MWLHVPFCLTEEEEHRGHAIPLADIFKENTLRLWLLPFLIQSHFPPPEGSYKAIRTLPPITPTKWIIIQSKCAWCVRREQNPGRAGSTARFRILIIITPHTGRPQIFSIHFICKQYKFNVKQKKKPVPWWKAVRTIVVLMFYEYIYEQALIHWSQVIQWRILNQSASQRTHNATIFKHNHSFFSFLKFVKCVGLYFLHTSPFPHSPIHKVFHPYCRFPYTSSSLIPCYTRAAHTVLCNFNAVTIVTFSKIPQPLMRRLAECAAYTYAWVHTHYSQSNTQTQRLQDVCVGVWAVVWVQVREVSIRKPTVINIPAVYPAQLPFLKVPPRTILSTLSSDFWNLMADVDGFWHGVSPESAEEPFESRYNLTSTIRNNGGPETRKEIILANSSLWEQPTFEKTNRQTKQ